MESLINSLPDIIQALGVIILGYFTYNQYRKNKKTDLELEKVKAENDLKIAELREEQDRKSRRRNDNSMIIQGELWDILSELNADRVYIVQPHPLGNEDSLSVYYEVKRKGVEPMKPHIQQLPISQVSKFASELAKHLFRYITNIDEQVQDKYAKSIMSAYGSTGVIVKRLSNNEHDWVGSIFCEFTHDSMPSEEDAHEVMHRAATNIQYILPEYK